LVTKVSEQTVPAEETRDSFVSFGSAMTINVDVISDVICPWCYIGKRRLEKAVALGGRDTVRVRWHPLELNPQMPKTGLSRREYRTAKFGSWERSLALDAQVSEAGLAEGISFAFDKIQRTPNSFDAHRLIWLADQVGTQDSIVEALFRAYFTEGRDIADARTLLEVVCGAGLDRIRAETLLGGDEGRDAVLAAEEQAGRAGVQGVPFFIVNDSLMLSGAREPKDFLAAFNQAGASATDTGSTCKIEPGEKPSC
jgi:predicted DsbA family dithiol-disulfide isomerase